MKIQVLAFIITLVFPNIILISDTPIGGTGGSPYYGSGLIDWSLQMDIANVSSGSFIGEDPYDRLRGIAIGDVNNDGYCDFALNSLNDEGGLDAGKVYIIFGNSTGWSSNLSATGAAVVIVGENPGDYIYGVGAEDINGDGIDDLVISASYNDQADEDAGKVYLIFGRLTQDWPDKFDLSDADASFLGEKKYDRAGYNIMGPGDITGDGIDDLLIGSPFNDEGGTDAGQSYVLFGRKDPLSWDLDTPLSEVNASFIGNDVFEYLTYSEGGLSDINNDGIKDFLLGTNPSYSGANRKATIYLIFGKKGGWSRDTIVSSVADASFIEENIGDMIRPNWAQDVNGDGFGDILIGSEESNEYDKAGKTYIFFGNEAGWKMGTSVENADTIIYCRDFDNQPTSGGAPSCDLNGDGIHDLIYLAPGSDTGGIERGQIYVIFGGQMKWESEMDLSDADVSIIGERTGDHFGSTLQPVKDVNGDGYDDLIVTAKDYDLEGQGEDHGKVYLILGRPTLGDPPTITLDEDHLLSQFKERIVSGELEIKWYATDKEDSENLTISIFYRSLDSWWKPIMEGLDNTGSYIWDTMNPRVADDEAYFIMVKAFDSTGKTNSRTSSFTLEINNPDPPEVEIIYPGQEDTLSGLETITWEATDGEDNDLELLIDIWLMGGPDGIYEQIATEIENTGSFDVETSDFPDGVDYAVMIRVKDTTGMYGHDTVGSLTIHNTPSIEIFQPEKDEVLSDLYSVKYRANDPSDERYDLLIDMWVLSERGEEYEVFTKGNNTWEYDLNTSAYPNGDNYRLMMMVTDPSGLNSTTISENFTIWNKNEPTVLFTSPEEYSLQKGVFTIDWSAFDVEDASEDLRYSLYYKMTDTEMWRELAYDALNTGSLNVDTMDFIQGDGSYTFMILVEDSDGMISDPDYLILNVYNPNAPIIRYPTGPYDQVRDGSAFLYWTAEDPDPGETEGLKVWLYVSLDEENWILMADGIDNENEYTMDVSELEDGSYHVKIVVADMQPGDDYRETEELFSRMLVVNNINDAPIIELVDSPQAGIEYSGKIYINWTGSDADGDDILYTLYYKEVNGIEWIPMDDAVDIRANRFVWDISELPTGDYQIKIVGKEDYKDALSMEQLSETFFIRHIDVDIGEDDRQVTINYGLLFGVGAGFVILGLIIVWIMFLNVRKNRVGLEEEDMNGGSPEDEDDPLTRDLDEQGRMGAPALSDVLHDDVVQSAEE